MTQQELEQVSNSIGLSSISRSPRLARRASAGRVEIGEGEPTRGGQSCCAAQERTHARLINSSFAERLDQVVVGAGIETRDAVTYGVLGREQEYGHLAVAGAQPAADLDAVPARHHHVEHDEVERAHAHTRQRFGAVRGEFDLEFLRARHPAPSARRRAASSSTTRMVTGASVRLMSETCLKTRNSRVTSPTLRRLSARLRTACCARTDERPCGLRRPRGCLGRALDASASDCPASAWASSRSKAAITTGSWLPAEPVQLGDGDLDRARALVGARVGQSVQHVGCCYDARRQLYRLAPMSRPSRVTVRSALVMAERDRLADAQHPRRAAREDGGTDLGVLLQCRRTRRRSAGQA